MRRKCTNIKSQSLKSKFKTQGIQDMIDKPNDGGAK